MDTFILDGEVTDKVNDPSSSSESSSSGASADCSQNRTGHNYKCSTSPASVLAPRVGVRTQENPATVPIPQ